MTNTGEQSGTIRLLELSLKKPLQWSICLLHLNEIIIRHIIERVDGPNIGPDTYLGDVGKAICSMSKDPQKYLTKFVNFKAVCGKVPEQIDPQLLVNQDQFYFYAICIGIQKGHLDPYFTYKVCGKLNLSR